MSNNPNDSKTTDTGNAPGSCPAGTDYSGLKAALDECESWPCDYTFKFICPTHKLGDLKALFKGWEFSTRPSRKGNYTSLTVTGQMASSDEVISLYQAASQVDGVMCL